MYIKTDVMGANILNNQRILSRQIQENTNRLSSGLRINAASDDSAGLSISQRFQSKIRENEMMIKNTKDQSNFLSTKEGIYQSITDQLQKVRELSVKAQNGTYSNGDIKNIQGEINEILESIDNMVENGTFNGIKLIKTGAALDGVNDYISIPNSPSLQFGTGDFSVSLDFKLESFQPVTVNQIISTWDAAGIRGFEIQIHKSGAIEFGVKDGTHKQFVAPGAIQLGKPYKIDMVRENNVVNAYINGEKVAGSITTGSSTTPSPLLIGKEPNGSEFFDGTISNVRIFNRALNEDDIEKHQMGLNVEGSLVSKWLDNDNKGTQAKDETGNGINGTMMNGASWADYSTYIGLSNFDVADNSFIQKIDAALDEITKERSTIGSFQNKLEMRVNNLEQSTIQFNQSNSRIKDADISEESAKMLKEQVKLEVSYSMLQKNNEHSGQVVQLLRG